MDFDRLHTNISELKIKYSLTDFRFDTECIYDLGDLSFLINSILKTTLPEFAIEVSERYSSDKTRYEAILTNAGHSMKIYGDVGIDWLPDDFFLLLESIPEVFKTNKKYYSINPAIGLTGQDAWYFCGTGEQLKAARADGIPLIFPGENMLETKEFKEFNR
jgi:hypothetical protein